VTRARRGLKLIGVPVEPDTHTAIVELAEEWGEGKPLPLAQVVRLLIDKALEKGWDRLVAKDLADAGYQDGLRRGLHEAKTKIAGAMKGSW
jgi:hypothetical protein